MLGETTTLTDQEVRDVIDLTTDVSEEKRRAIDRLNDRVIAIQEAQKQVKERGEFIPKDINVVDVARLRF